MPRSFVELVGWTAAALMLSAYVLLTIGKMSSRSRSYHWLNVLAGLGIIVNSGWNGAFPSVFINVVWVGIGLYGLIGRALDTAPQNRTSARVD